MNVEKIKKINKTIVHSDGTVDSFDRQLLAYASGSFDKSYMFVIKADTKCLEYVKPNNIDDPLVMTYKTLRHISEKHPDDFIFLSKINDMLENSQIAMDSMDSSLKSYRLIVTDSRVDNNRPLIAVVKLNTIKNEIELDELRSVYNKKEFSRFLIDTYNCNKRIYCNEKTESFIKSIGVPFPEEMINLFCDSDFKGVISKSQSDIYRRNLLDFKKEEFSFGIEGFHFYPAKRFTDIENNIKYISNNYAFTNKFDIDYHLFYDTAGNAGEENKTYDIFYCLETDLFYIPTGKGVCIWQGEIEDSLPTQNIVSKYRQKYIAMSEKDIEKTMALKEKKRSPTEKMKENFVKDMAQQKSNGPVTFGDKEKDNARRKEEDIVIEI